MSGAPPREFEELLFAEIVDAIEGLSDETAVCALSLYVWWEWPGIDEDGVEAEEELPALNLGYNTTPHFTVKALEARPYDAARMKDRPLSLFDGPAIDENEARWNPAHFKDQWYRQFREDHFPNPALLSARERWVAAFAGDVDAAAHAFVNLVYAIAQRLHTEGHLRRVFGRPLPVFVEFDHDVEDGELLSVEIAEGANPPELIEGYRAWRLRLDP